MSQTVTELLAPPKSAQDQQFEQWAAAVSTRIAAHGQSLNDLPEQVRTKLVAELQNEVAKLNDEVKSKTEITRAEVERLASYYAAGNPYAGPHLTRQAAAQFGAIAVAAALGTAHPQAQAALKIATISPATGPTGGFAVNETIWAGIANRLPAYGVFERNCPAQPCNHVGKVLTWTDGFVVYHPDVNGAPTPSAGTIGVKTVQLTRYSVLTLIDRWLLSEPTLVALGDLVAEGMARAIAKATDKYGFLGDGSAACARVQGIFHWDTSNASYIVTGVDGDNTFAEYVDKLSVYLAAALGALPAEYDDDGLRWYGHRSIFFRYLGARDTSGRPIADIYAAERPGQRYTLLGVPFEAVREAPSLGASTQNSTVMMVLANLRAACVLARHPLGVEMRRSEEYKWAEGMTALCLDALQDILKVNREAVIHLITAAT